MFGSTGGIGRALVDTLAQGGWRVVAGSRAGATVKGAASQFSFDLTDEASIAAAATEMDAIPPDLVIVATGVLTLPSGLGPEKSLKQLDPEALGQAFAINAVGPAMIAKHFLPLLPRDRRSVFTALGARVGSITDNRLGGWYGYRASKAALAMLIRNFAIEMRRTHPDAIIAGLHPGTVDTRLSAPFQRGLPPGQLQEAPRAAAHILAVIEGLTPDDSGRIFDWNGLAIAP